MSGRSLVKPLVWTAIVLVVIGSLTAMMLSPYGYLPGDAMVRSWSAAKDRTSSGQDDNWVVGDVAIRSRYDEVTGFGLAAGQDGKKLWEYVPPGRTQMCGAAPHAGAGVVLVAYEDDGTGEGSTPDGVPVKACSNVLALDAKDGRELWKEHSNLRRDSFGDVVAGSSPRLDAGGGLAVVAQDRRATTSTGQKDKGGDVSLRGLDVRTGKQRWAAELPDRCGPDTVSVGRKRVFAVLTCGSGGRDKRAVAEVTVAAFDRATGALEWNVPVDARRPLDPKTAVGIESADPLVLTVGVSADSPGNTGLFISFDENGRPRPTIELDREQGVIQASTVMSTAVVGDRLYALAKYWKKGNHHTVIAFDLKTGEEVWSQGMDDPAAGMAVIGDRVTVLCEWSTQSAAITTMVELDAADGEELDERHFRDEVPGLVGGMYERDGRLVVAGLGGSYPFTAYERW
ncbi:outer membrane protein assembly factor BamB family protein [Streptomyces atratus]|uniref:outer membrane protein assembly factor BamB family protein n=1 Tax=Streptomyces atratus TaxID=1893 RepID=UPI00166FDA98|nr:PQQ-binding-like beta-propeller repeat protein [Streptomyces atratus]